MTSGDAHAVTSVIRHIRSMLLVSGRLSGAIFYAAVGIRDRER